MNIDNEGMGSYMDRNDAEQIAGIYKKKGKVAFSVKRTDPEKLFGGIDYVFDDMPAPSESMRHTMNTVAASILESMKNEVDQFEKSDQPLIHIISGIDGKGRKNISDQSNKSNSVYFCDNEFERQFQSAINRSGTAAITVNELSMAVIIIKEAVTSRLLLYAMQGEKNITIDMAENLATDISSRLFSTAKDNGYSIHASHVLNDTNQAVSEKISSYFDCNSSEYMVPISIIDTVNQQEEVIDSFFALMNVMDGYALCFSAEIYDNRLGAMNKIWSKSEQDDLSENYPDINLDDFVIHQMIIDMPEHIGKNHRSEVALFGTIGGEAVILLEERQQEPFLGRFALPGVQVKTNAKPGAVFKMTETPEAAISKMLASLNVSAQDIDNLLSEKMIHEGHFDNYNRDPRSFINPVDPDLSRVISSDVFSIDLDLLDRQDRARIFSSILGEGSKQNLILAPVAQIESGQISMAFDHQDVTRLVILNNDLLMKSRRVSCEEAIAVFKGDIIKNRIGNLNLDTIKKDASTPDGRSPSLDRKQANKLNPSQSMS